MSASEAFSKLRGLLTEDHSIRSVAGRANIPYLRLYRFKHKEGKLSLEDAEKLCIALTGKTFISLENVL